MSVDRRIEHRPQRTADLGRATQFVVGLATLTIGLIGVLSAPSEEYEGVGVVVLVLIAATSIPLSLLWFVGSWPKPWQLIAFIAYSDVTIALSLWFKVEYLMAIGGTVLFAVVAVLAVIACPIWVSLVHVAFSVLVLGLIAVRTLLAGVDTPWVIAAHSLTMLLMFFTPSIMILYIYDLRNKARSALLDPLTGLANRRGLFDEMRILDEELAASRDVDTVAVVTIDIDRFKEINDRQGHLAGDAALVLLAGHLGALAPSARAVARMGGDEFACIFAGSTNAVECQVRGFVDDLTAILSASIMSVSLGVSSTGIGSHTDVHAALSRILAEADENMYRVKSRKRDAALA